MTMIDVLMNLVRSAKRKEQASPTMLLQMEDMAERNRQRIERIKNEMGDKYILHPSHMKSRLEEPRPV